MAILAYYMYNVKVPRVVTTQACICLQCTPDDAFKGGYRDVMGQIQSDAMLHQFMTLDERYAQYYRFARIIIKTCYELLGEDGVRRIKERFRYDDYARISVAESGSSLSFGEITAINMFVTQDQALREKMLYVRSETRLFHETIRAMELDIARYVIEYYCTILGTPDAPYIPEVPFTEHTVLSIPSLKLKNVYDYAVRIRDKSTGRWSVCTVMLCKVPKEYLSQVSTALPDVACSGQHDSKPCRHLCYHPLVGRECDVRYIKKNPVWSVVFTAVVRSFVEAFVSEYGAEKTYLNITLDHAIPDISMKNHKL